MSLVLGACAGQSPGDGETSTSSGSSSATATIPTTVPTAQASASASQLANSTTLTLNDALALAAGRPPAAPDAPAASTGAITGALPPVMTVNGAVGVNPVAVDAIPTVAAAEPSVETAVTEIAEAATAPTANPVTEIGLQEQPAIVNETSSATGEMTASGDVDTSADRAETQAAPDAAVATSQPAINAFETLPTTAEDTASEDVEVASEDIDAGAAAVEAADTTDSADSAQGSDTGSAVDSQDANATSAGDSTASTEASEPTTAAQAEAPPSSESPVEPTPATEVAASEPSPDVATETASGTSPDSTASTGDQGNSGTAESGGEKRFSSRNTPGFVGELLDDGTVKVDWQRDPAARGYNVYRDSEYFTTVYTNSFVDDDIYDQNYYYEIQSFDYDEKFTTVAIGLTVQVSGLGRTDPDAPARNADLLENFSLVFADEFDTGALDSTKWNTSFLWGPDLVINSESQYYVDIVNQPDFGFDPFTFENGNMVINSVPTPPALAAKANNQPYLSGIITSYDSFKFTYGYVETRARLPYGKGLWPAFWLLNSYYVDDKPEIDIMEFIGQDQDVVFHTYHYHDASDALVSTASKPTKGTDWTADFHTYGVDWRPGQLIFYIDGVEVHRINDSKVSSQDMYVIANTALGGWWAGPPDASTPFPARYELDYIRVYQQNTPYETGPLNDFNTDIPTTVVNTGPATEERRSPGHRAPAGPWLP